LKFKKNLWDSWLMVSMYIWFKNYLIFLSFVDNFFKSHMLRFLYVIISRFLNFIYVVSYVKFLLRGWKSIRLGQKANNFKFSKRIMHCLIQCLWIVVTSCYSITVYRGVWTYALCKQLVLNTTYIRARDFIYCILVL